ncbi:Lipopolysaccharide export system ATP-binding protein LptB [Pigmentiphaga humi]|uniref:Lipopolysaccharide export system ATP-binding protein LptB n=1 Tax=Pigmentiphaga humi TaxID=2478468 RepID=A0A3P4B058_9BURK|nr:ABC transporter ATP-binding protein [Pigmentiphaga humi]VCU68495.1 Lipopolysaccharide export system ATP-binding protein LptB [Pigmentiphaga humi]
MSATLQAGQNAAALATPSLRTSKLTKRFGGFVAVNDVTLDIAPGSRQALIGPNGAGKTTLINLLTGILRPTEGRIYLGDEDITGLSADARVHRGLVRTFQINSLFPRLTPHQAASLAIAERDGLGKVWWRTLRSCPQVADEAHALLEQFSLGRYANTDTSELPYGKQRLLEIVLALAAKPRILLLDEPAAGVPEDESGELFEVISALPREMTVLFIEHDMDLVFRFAQRISVLVAGAVLVEGTPAEIAADPQVRAAYLGNSRV